MKTHKRQLVFPALAILITVLAVVGAVIVGSIAAERPSQAQGAKFQNAATSIRVSTIERREIPVSASFHGFLEAFVELTVATQVAGEITDQWVDVSDDVVPGQALFKIDDETRRFERDQALARQTKARHGLETAKANWERVQALPEQSSTSLENIESHRTFLTAVANATEADVAASHADLMLERTTVFSPIRGVISRLHQRRGEFVRRGQPLLDVIEIDRLKLVAEVADHEVIWIREGDLVMLTTDALPGKSFSARVHFIYPQAEASSRRFQIEIELPNPKRRFRPGFFVRGEIVRRVAGESILKALVVPREALFERFGQVFTYRVEADESEGDRRLVARRISVDLLPIRSDPRLMRISSGLVEGDRVVTKGIQHLTDGAPVRILE